MKYIGFFILFFLPLKLEAQASIMADVRSGCNPMQVTFTIEPSTARDTITTIEWNFGNWTTVKTDLSPVVLFNLSGVFDVICVINGTTQITENNFIAVSDCPDTLKIPNVFSPNEDNVNDFFEVKTNGTSIYSLAIYTRSGTLIYKTESPIIQWDGRSLSGHKMKNGIYFYIIRQLESEPLNEFKGIVYLFE